MIAIVQNLQEIGLSQVEFARNHNFKIATLRYWISKTRQTVNDQPAFVQIGGIVSLCIHIRYPHGVERSSTLQICA